MSGLSKSGAFCLMTAVVLFLRVVKVNSEYICFKENETVYDQLQPHFTDDDYFRVWFRLLAPNGVQVKLSAETAEALHKFYKEHSYEDNQKYMINLFQKIPQWDESGKTGGGIEEIDYSYPTVLIHQGFHHFQDKVLKMDNKRQCSAAIYLTSKRTDRWLEDEANELISYKNKFEDDDNCCSASEPFYSDATLSLIKNIFDVVKP